jgi:aldehyde dehydrogenase (NAD+)
METMQIPKSETQNQALLLQQVERVFSAQRQYQRKLYPISLENRLKKLRSLVSWVEGHKSDIHTALYKDFKKPVPDIDLTEIWMCKMELKTAIRNLKKWTRPHKVSRTLPFLTTRSWIQYEPRGVVLIISPWNYPLNLTFGPLASAIAAGNSVILKPSEFSPHTAHLMSQAVSALFNEEEVALFEGEKDVAIALLEKPFDHIFFTGSSETGKKVMSAAAKNLSSVTLELGGKSPTIIDPSADLNDAAKKVVWGKFMNCGQTCLAPDYLLVHQSVYSKFLDILDHTVDRLFKDSVEGSKHVTDYARIINDGHFEILRNLLNDALDRGAVLRSGGTLDASDRFIAPTILTNVSMSAHIMKQEIFGPLLTILTYNSLDKVLTIINGLPKPLALYIFCRNKKTTAAILSKTSAGGTCINDTVVNYSHMKLPFGGVGNSGIGSAHGFFGFKAFSHERAVLKHHKYTPLAWLYPPFTGRVRKLIDLVVKYF